MDELALSCSGHVVRSEPACKCNVLGCAFVAAQVTGNRLFHMSVFGPIVAVHPFDGTHDDGIVSSTQRIISASTKRSNSEQSGTANKSNHDVQDQSRNWGIRGGGKNYSANNFFNAALRTEDS